MRSRPSHSDSLLVVNIQMEFGGNKDEKLYSSGIHMFSTWLVFYLIRLTNPKFHLCISEKVITEWISYCKVTNYCS
jgi:hypothetical protein